MSDEIRSLLDHGAARPLRPLDVDAVLSRSRQLGRRRGIAAVVAIAIVLPGVAVGASLARRTDQPGTTGAEYVSAARTLVAAPGDEVVLPAERSVTAVVLNDGSRVYVVRDEDGQVTVVEAISTHRPFGLQKQIGWCPTSGGFEDVQHGSRWDADGRYLYGPAPRDLTTRAHRIDGTTVHVGHRVEAVGRSRGAATAGDSCTGLGENEQGEERAVARMHFADFPNPAAALVSFEEFATDTSPRTGVFAVDAFVELGGYKDHFGSGIAVCGAVAADPTGTPTHCSGGPHFLLRASPGDVGASAKVLVGRVRLLISLRGQLSRSDFLTTDDVVRLPQTATFVPDRPGLSPTFGYLRATATDGAEVTLTLDEAQFLGGQEATDAARADGVIGAEDTVPNDYYIRNVATATTTYRVDSRAEVLTLNDEQGLVPTSLADFARSGKGTSGQGSTKVRLVHVFRTADGTVARIVEQYVP